MKVEESGRQPMRVSDERDLEQFTVDSRNTEHPVQVRVSHLEKSFRRRRESIRVLRDIDLDVREGELLVLLGPSGCGKTTLLRCLVGLERPDGGSIELGGSPVVDVSKEISLPPNKRDVGMVFQNYALWPHMKIGENVAYPLKARNMKRELKEGRVAEVLDVVQCGHLSDRYPPELSGGQQQRVSLARALAPRPTLLLLDEPLSNLDALLRVELRAQLRVLHRELGFTAVYVTHDQEEALALGTRVAVMRSGQIEQIGAPSEVYRLPATEYVADFLGARNQLVLDADGGSIAGQPVGPALDPQLRGAYTLRIRPNHLKIREIQPESHPGGQIWLKNARVLEVIPGSEHYEHLLELDGVQLTAYVPLPQGAFVAGQQVEVGIDPGNAYCYGKDGALVRSWYSEETS